VGLLINVALGLMTRFGEEFEVLMLAFPIRIAVGFFVMAATIPVWVHLAGRLSHHMIGQIVRLLNT
jgi:flagellar biosynthesis protein FliR